MFLSHSVFLSHCVFLSHSVFLSRFVHLSHIHKSEILLKISGRRPPLNASFLRKPYRYSIIATIWISELPFYSFYQKLLPLSPIEICPPLEQFLCSQSNVERRYFFIRLGFVRRETYMIWKYILLFYVGSVI